MKDSLFVDGAALAWRPTPCAGVAWKKLYFDPQSGESAVLLRFEPGATYDAHRHPAGERYLVLEGELEDGGHRYGPMRALRRMAHVGHRPIAMAAVLELAFE
ncbi:MAG: cupin domain-containing protein, partial [Planctomycetota bacterium]